MRNSNKLVLALKSKTPGFSLLSLGVKKETYFPCKPALRGISSPLWTGCGSRPFMWKNNSILKCLFLAITLPVVALTDIYLRQSCFLAFCKCYIAFSLRHYKTTNNTSSYSKSTNSWFLLVSQDTELLLSLWSSVWFDLPSWSLTVSDWSETVFSIHCHWLDMWICLGPLNVPQFAWNCRLCLYSYGNRPSDQWGKFYCIWTHSTVSQKVQHVRIKLKVRGSVWSYGRLFIIATKRSLTKLTGVEIIYWKLFKM